MKLLIICLRSSSTIVGNDCNDLRGNSSEKSLASLEMLVEILVVSM